MVCGNRLFKNAQILLKRA